MRDQVIAYLTALGVTGADTDPLLDLVIDKTTFRVRNETNVSADTLSEGLESVAVDMAVGEYLKYKKTTGQLTGFDLEAAVKQIQEGDTNISFAMGEGSSTPEQRLNSLIDYLINGRFGELRRFRKVIW